MNWKYRFKKCHPELILGSIEIHSIKEKLKPVTIDKFLKVVIIRLNTLFYEPLIPRPIENLGAERKFK
ncbi:hypothetical protein [Christiangramia sp.]|uniref:hypothetical protein n=1 Tax=Christiangramia sp. TaxID=1931228 RepID=UPI002612F953|nr:hypothetical protein [Christiangramia sp.]